MNLHLIPPFIATGIGSLPHIDPVEAVRTVKQFFPDMPHWPQLPSNNTSEGLIGQYIAPLVRLGLVDKESGSSPFFVRQSNWLDRLTEFYDLYLRISEGDDEALSHFGLPYEYAKGFWAFVDELSNGGFHNAKYIKGQVTGPITLGLQLTDQNRRSSYYDEELRDIVVKTLALQASWQVETLNRFGIPVVIFIDEPGLYAYGQSTHITLNKQEIIDELNIIVDTIHSAGGSAGIHVCASTDWGMLLESRIDILNFDAFEYFTTLSLYPENIQNFLHREGVLAWGIVPTSEKVWAYDSDQLTKKLNGQIDTLVGKGIDRNALLAQMMITPSCGVGSLTTDIANKVYGLTKELSIKYQQMF
ncbi:methionine synthase [Desulfosporosinus metallidurans]|uniref:methionine synthase n=1 Tax=Desulfosporosinus metallidurans TaxID=1888891 RepID=UPI00094DC49C|nr:methionine synthase [Desulfosporosinus metallidurans]